MSQTRPVAEQLRFNSANTGEHVLDVYLEAAERGGRPLASILADLWDSDGNLVLTGLVDWRGEWATATDYLVGDTFRTTEGGRSKVYVTLQNHTSSSISADETASRIAVVIDNTEDILSGLGLTLSGNALKYVRVKADASGLELADALILQDETQALYDAMQTKPTVGRLALIDNTIRRLKAAGLWAKMDVLGVFAGHGGGYLVDWRDPSRSFTENSGIVWTEDKGHTGDETADYLDLNVSLSSLTQYQQDSAHVGFWINGGSDAAALKYAVGLADSDFMLVAPRTDTGTIGIGLNNGVISLSSGTVSTTYGYTVANRSSSTDLQGYRDGVLVGNASSASSAPVSSTIVVHRADTDYSAFRIPLVHIGSSLTASEVADLYRIFGDYLSAVGAMEPVAASRIYGTDASGNKLWLSKTFVEFGQHSIMLTSGKPNVTNGPASYSAETATNKTPIVGYAFDASTEESMWFDFVLPKSWDGGPFSCMGFWGATGGTAGQGVVWGFSARVLTDTSDWDAANGAEVTVTDTLTAHDSEHITDVSAAITPSGDLGGGPKRVKLKVARKVGDAADTLAADAILQGVLVLYGVSAANDD